MQTVAIVVGGTRRVGRWVSEALLVQGAQVHAIYRSNEQAASQATDELAAAGLELHTHRADATDDAAIAEAVRLISGDAGRIGVLVNCAGPADEGRLLESDAAQTEALWRGNVLTVHNAAVATVPLMRGGVGRIINFLTIGADTARAFRQIPLYAAAKAMLASYSRSLARELAPDGITVNCIALGATSLPAESVPAVDAAALPTGTQVSQEDVAAAVWYLTGPASGQLTGSVLNLSGGWAL
jgi:3-oxoacyl-[acyl-carrier protein] reductase